MRTIKLSALVLGVILIFTSCQKKAEEPVLPPTSSVAIDDQEFQSSKSGEKIGTYWFAAAMQVGFWSAAINTTFAIPVYAYQHALEQDPTQVDDNTWLWQYSVSFMGHTYQVKLYGIVDNNTVHWELYVNDFKWFEGSTDVDATSGTWVFYNLDSVATVQVDWTFNSSDSTGTSKFTIINPDNDGYGSYIYYGNTMTGDFNCFFNIYNNNDSSTCEIRWSKETHAGAIKSPKILFDDNWHCWDENLNNCDCPDGF